MTKLPMTLLLLSAVSLSACGGITRFRDGDTLEARGVVYGATEVVGWQHTDVQTGLQNRGVVTGESLTAKLVPVGAAMAVAKIQGRYALDVAAVQAEGCRHKNTGQPVPCGSNLSINVNAAGGQGGSGGVAKAAGGSAQAAGGKSVARAAGGNAAAGAAAGALLVNHNHNKVTTTPPKPQPPVCKSRKNGTC